MKIYTRTGDNGTTSLSDGSRIQKDSLLLHSYGTVDELNSFLGVLISQFQDNFLSEIQNQLFVVGGMLATPTSEWDKFWNKEQIPHFTSMIESEIDRLSADLPPMKGFILPQGNSVIAAAHVCRTVCRRAERHVCGLLHEDEVYKDIQILLNRLSDYFFILARFLHKISSIDETLYKPKR